MTFGHIEDYRRVIMARAERAGQSLTMLQLLRRYGSGWKLNRARAALNYLVAEGFIMMRPDNNGINRYRLNVYERG